MTNNTAQIQNIQQNNLSQKRRIFKSVFTIKSRYN